MKINRILTLINKIIDDSLNEKILNSYFSKKTTNDNLENNFEYGRLNMQLNNSKLKIKNNK